MADDERAAADDERAAVDDERASDDLTVRIADHRWIAATDYGDGANMTRSGVWIPQRSGGWWTAPTLDRALRDCPDPVIYRTRKAARESIT